MSTQPNKTQNRYLSENRIKDDLVLAKDCLADHPVGDFKSEMEGFGQKDNYSINSGNSIADEQEEENLAARVEFSWEERGITAGKQRMYFGFIKKFF